MRFMRAFLVFVSFTWSIAVFAADLRITVYNQNFAVVRQTVPLSLIKGVSEIHMTDVTAHLEPDSVILRDPAGKRVIQVLEQNYRADPVSQDLLLSLFEGKVIDFLLQNADGSSVTIPGKIVRSGYVPHSTAMQRYGSQYSATQAYMVQGGAGQPIIEVDGKLRFNLPGIPLFPSLGDDTILKPMLTWLIASDQTAKFEAEMSYVTGGMNWQADYNIVAPEQGELLELVGWVTIDNQSGKTFENAKIKLLAGDVKKIQPAYVSGAVFGGVGGGMGAVPPVSERSFEDYHIYDLDRPATIHDRETKQVEFIRAAGIKSARIYVYDGMKTDDRFRGYNTMSIRQEREYGVLSNHQVWVMREFVNSEANHLGMPLPQGRVRFYRRDQDDRLEFTGEDNIDHTPRDETIRAFTGSAFDIVGERTRTDFRIDNARMWLDESFEIKLRNHKKESAEVRVVEHLYRGSSWSISASSNTFLKTDSQTMEFRVEVGPGQEKTITYTVHYTW